MRRMTEQFRILHLGNFLVKKDPNFDTHTHTQTLQEGSENQDPWGSHPKPLTLKPLHP